MRKESSTELRPRYPEDVELEPDAADTSRLDIACTRRAVLAGSIGLAAVGAIGGSLLVPVASPAAFASGMGAQLPAVAPSVVFLVDAPTISVDASLGNDFRVTIAGNRTMGNPSNAVNGQQVIFQVTQGAGGSYAVTWSDSYDFSTGLPLPVLSTTAGETDLLGFIYNGVRGQWLLAAFVNGFS